MKLRNITAALVTAGALTVIAVPAVVTAAPALAAGQICTHGGPGKCLNDWNGAGVNGPVKMGQNGWANQSFGAVYLSGACGGGHVTSTCPYSNHVIDGQLLGAPIYAVRYNGNGLCVGSGQNDSRALLEPCPDSNGNGGGWGTLNAEGQNSICHQSNGDAIFVNVHWTNTLGSQAMLVGSETNGAQVSFFGNAGLEACWGTG